MPRSRLAIVGAGVAGLAAANELVAAHEVTVIDRLPVPGGVLGYEASAVVELDRAATVAGVRRMLGVTAVRWSDGRLLTVGPGGIGWQDFDHLVYAGGNRPATAAELRITGPRLAGVLPATVALHFAEAGVLLGRHVVFVGSGDWATAAARVISKHDCRITVVVGEGEPPPGFRHDAVICGWSPARVEGSGRVSSLFLTRSGVEHRIVCDAVILADSPRPLRNVDGAVLDPSPRVSFVQPIASRSSAQWTVDQARTAAAGLMIDPRIEVSV